MTNDDNDVILRAKEKNMNPQPSNFLPNIVVIIFVGTCIYYFLTSKQSISLDNITVGYVERNTRPVNVVVHNDINTKKIDEKLFQECVSALHSLGYNRRSAKKLADKVFQKHDVKTTQQFISLAFKEDV